MKLNHRFLRERERGRGRERERVEYRGDSSDEEEEENRPLAGERGATFRWLTTVSANLVVGLLRVHEFDPVCSLCY